MTSKIAKAAKPATSSMWRRVIAPIVPKVAPQEQGDVYLGGRLQEPHPYFTSFLVGWWKFRYLNPLNYLSMGIGMIPYPLPITSLVPLAMRALSAYEVPKGRIARAFDERWDKYYLKYKAAEPTLGHMTDKKELMHHIPGFTRKNNTYRTKFKLEAGLMKNYLYGYKEGFFLAVVIILYLDWVKPKYFPPFGHDDHHGGDHHDEAADAHHADAEAQPQH